MESTFNRVLIASDFSPMDDKLMSYTSFLSKISEIDKIYLLHIIPNFSQPQNKDLEFHKLFSTGYPVDEKVKDLLIEKSNAFFSNNGVEVFIDVIEGKPYQKLLHWTEVKDIDLVVIGRKSISQNSGITAKRMARNTKSNVMFIPEEAKEKISKILVPVDFSENAALALRTALDFRRKAKHEVEVTALHVVQMLMTDHYYGLSLNPKFQSMLMETAKETFEDFNKEHDFNPDSFKEEFVVNNSQNIPAHLSQYLDSNECDLVIMGAQGHSAFERFLVGSTTEQFVNQNDEVPILIVR